MGGVNEEKTEYIGSHASKRMYVLIVIKTGGYVTVKMMEKRIVYKVYNVEGYSDCSIRKLEYTDDHDGNSDPRDRTE